MSKADQWHRATVLHFDALPKPFVTCEPVIAEVCFLVHSVDGGVDKALNLISAGVVQTDFELSAEIESIRALMSKYRDVPMSLADACLVRMSEVHPESSVFTLDSDFRIYRKHRNSRIPLIMPDRI